MSLRLLKAAAAALAFTALVPALAGAQQFERPVRIVVPFAPGGTSDILARLIAPKLSEAVGQPVVVENKPGAAGNIGADSVAKAKPDGHTLLLMDIGSLAVAPSLFPDLSYNVENDLAPVGMVMFGPYVLAVNPSVPAKNVPELVAYAKANPGKLAVANSGVGALNHITAVALARHLGIDWKNVPYKGGAAASRAVVSGESNVIINGATATLPFVTNKQLTGIAVTGDERLAALPDVETFKQAKLPLDDAGTWQGLLTTGKTPPEVVAKLNAELNKILAMPEIQAKVAEQGGSVRPGTPEAVKSWLATNIKSWGDIVRAADIKTN
ncbi:Bug family tripartite tricarboxylate transporter substrate binding protein [Ancylobacter oerskovii]|uniref:Bug family tripartite tricarboxylate transporter substrate binding protein n=1 Tax=Ancylobacter oerskovii TaxID=459519 RepID=A0ABW4YZG1_9HYPH|nr:tripartite tricarboxylate transporter substrate binding protein [Ancylobacter oerskovii]MBS7543915.1 tripartite tricarboxylate transporter substrate binding protein [Ancylobacter oerskovii]